MKFLSSSNLKKLFYLFIFLVPLLSVCQALENIREAEVAKKPSEQAPTASASSHDGSAPYLISFLDEATEKNFQDATKWLQERNIHIDDSVNETYIRFIVAKMNDEDVKQLKLVKDTFTIEDVELDDISFDKSEL